jgi:multiple sugar transport system substrate-binding protein
MSKKGLSRRNFLKLSGSAAAFAAFQTQFPTLASAASLQQDVITVSFAGWGQPPEQEGVLAAIELFEQENPGIRVEWRHSPDNEFTRVFLSDVAAGAPADTSFIMSDTYETFRAEGLLMDITDRITSDPLLGQENYFLPQEAGRCADDNGRWHGIGSTWVAPHLYYNAALLEEAGVTPPGFKDDEIWDWNTFVENAKQLTMDSSGRHPDDSGFDSDDIVQWGVDYPLFPNPTYLTAAVFSNGGQFINENGSGLDSPEAMEALQNLADLIYVHHVAPRSAAMSSLGMNNSQMLDTGRLAMVVEGSWGLSWINSSALSIPLGVGALPKMTQAATYMQAHFHSALAASDHPDEAWEWIRFLATPFYQTQFMKIGLWLPSLTELTTEEAMDDWFVEGIHPENYRDFIGEYLPKYGVSIRVPNGYVEGNLNYITPAYEAIANGTSAADVIPDAVQQANEIIAAANEM